MIGSPAYCQGRAPHQVHLGIVIASAEGGGGNHDAPETHEKY